MAKEKSHLEELQELQVHRLSPGHYVGKLPPLPRGKLLLAGTLYFVLAVGMLLGWLAIFFNRNPDNQLATVIALVVLGSMLLLYILAGIGFVNRHRQQQKRRKS